MQAFNIQLDAVLNETDLKVNIKSMHARTTCLCEFERRQNATCIISPLIGIEFRAPFQLLTIGQSIQLITFNLGCTASRWLG